MYTTSTIYGTLIKPIYQFSLFNQNFNYTFFPNKKKCLGALTANLRFTIQIFLADEVLDLRINTGLDIPQINAR